MLEHPPTGIDAPVPPKVKRPSAFKNRPAWGAKPSAGPSPPRKEKDTGLESNFFSRSNDTLSRIAAESSKKSRVEAGRPESSNGRSKQSKEKDRADSEKEGSSGTEQPSKRRRLSDADDSSDHEELYSRPEESVGMISPKSPIRKPPPPPKHGKADQRDTKQTPRRTQQVTVIDLSDDSDEELAPAVVSPSKATVVDRSSPDSPIQSVETEQNGHTHARPKPAIEPPKVPSPGPNSIPLPQPASTTQQLEQRQQQPPQPDPVLKILVHSRLPNTVPLIVQRRFSQRLQEVRGAWCDKQGFTQEQSDTVYLTWRGRRIFDFTTCRSLGISLSPMGDVYIKGGARLEPGEEGSQIEMEAMTVELAEEIRREKEVATKAAAAETARAEEEGDAGGGAGSSGAGAGAGETKADQTKIFLRSKDYDEYRLLVRSTTTFDKIANAFRKARQVPSAKQVTLVFEGEKLDPGAEVQDSDVSQMDYIDVYVK